MSEIIQDILYIVLSVIIIGKGSDWFTDSLIPIAKRMGTSSASIGLILVAVGVSLPEVLIAVDGVVMKHSPFSFGVTIGSIACNIALMTGLCAFIKPLKVTTNIILRDGIFSITVPILVFAVAAGGQITKLEGFAFLILFLPYVVNVFIQEQQDTQSREELMRDIEIELDLLGFSFAKLRSPWVAFILGLGLLLFGSHLFTQRTIHLTTILGVSELLIGMTIGAIGPSIPNIVTAYQATRRGMHDIAVSATLGSNIFTLLVTLGILAIISPMTITRPMLTIDLVAIVIMSSLLFIFMVTGRVISRREGGMLIACYILLLLVKVFVAQY